MGEGQEGEKFKILIMLTTLNMGDKSFPDELSRGIWYDIFAPILSLVFTI